MFMSVVCDVPGSAVYGELAGGRVLITGLSAEAGADIASAFAAHKSSLVLNTPETTPEITELVTDLVKNAAGVKLFTQALDGADAVRFAQNAVAAFGGLDTVINIVPVSVQDFDGAATPEEIEARIAELLAPAVLVARVAANRMRLTWTEGSILNIVVMSAPRSARDAAVAGLVRSALAAVTRGEAAEWAEHAIRINAVGPRTADCNGAAGAVLASEADIAALALYVASRKGRGLSGHVFDAEGVATVRC